MTPVDVTNELGDVVERFDHVSMAVADLDSVEPLVTLVGGDRVDGGYTEQGDFDWVQYTLPHQGKLEFISTSSSDPGHFINRFIAERGEGLHHLTFKVASIEDAYRRADELGFAIVGHDTTDPSWKELFVHPKSTNGVLIQLAEFDD